MSDELCKDHSGVCAKICALEKRFADWDKSIGFQLDGLERSIDIAKEALDNRLAGMNEFRSQLNDQVRTFISRQELSVHVDKLEGKLIQAEKNVNEKFDLILRPINEKMDNLIRENSKREGAEVWKAAIVATALSFLVFLLSRYFFKF